MDKFKIDSHKYAYQPQHSSAVVAYVKNQESLEARNRYRALHPLYVEVSPVGACNHRCTFCAVDYIGYKSIFMDIQAYKSSIDSMKSRGCKGIMLAGEGEPLLHPDISEFVKYTKTEGNIDVAFTTNAYRLTKSFVEESLSHISWIKVSFNGGDADTYSKVHRTNANDFNVVSENIRYAVSYRNKHSIDCAIGLQVLLLPDNAHSISSLCQHAKELGVDYVVIKPYSQHRFSETRLYENIDYTSYLHLEDELSHFNTDSFNVIFRINTVKNWLSQNSDRYCKCYATPSTWAYWMADGSVYSCSAYLLDKRFLLGNINDDTFDQIWISDRRMENSDYVLNKLDITECRVNCRMDQVNRFLDSIVNETVPHMNFI